ncbi:MAG: TonB family protein [Acidobacteria bacterium]|nr:TonB family protein [Acidobacteriota bacterium]
MFLAGILILAIQAGASAQGAGGATTLAEGQRMLSAGRFQEALAAFDRAAVAGPDRAEVQLGRCRALAGLRNFDEALAACDRAIALEPANAEALRDRGHYKLNMGRIGDAQLDLERAEALNSADRNIYYHLGLAHYFKHEFAEAARQFQGCLSNSGQKADQIECDAWLYPSLVRAGQNDDARKLLDSIGPEPGITGHPAWYLDRLLLFKGAKAEEQVAANLNAEGALSLESIGYSLAVWHLLNNRPGRAHDYYVKVLSGDVPYAWGYRAAQADTQPDASSGQVAPGVYRVGRDVHAPRLISPHSEPAYSDEARRAKLEGTVVLQCIIAADGSVRDIHVQQGLGKGLDENAIDTVRSWKFEPALKEGAPVAVQVSIQVTFHLR